MFKGLLLQDLFDLHVPLGQYLSLDAFFFAKRRKLLFQLADGIVHFLL